MPYNFVTKDHADCDLKIERSSPNYYHLFPALIQNPDGHGFENDRESEKLCHDDR